MSTYVVPQEMIGLAGMPSTERNCLTKLNKLATVYPDKKRRREFGKGFEYHISLLPKEAREDLMLQRLMRKTAGLDAVSATSDAVSAGSVAVSTPAVAVDGQDPVRAVEGVLVDNAWDELTDKQRDCALARLAFVREIERACNELNVRQKVVIQELVDRFQAGSLPEHLAGQANHTGRAGAGLSARNVERWVAAFRKGGRLALAPLKTGVAKNAEVPTWWYEFKPFWQMPQKPSLAEAHRCYVAEAPGPHASLRQVSYFMGRLSEEAINWGRMSEQELKAYQAFKRLNFDHLDPNDVWQIDGHKFDALVINPLTGQRFRPEVTAIIDWATRVWCGFSVNVAESSISTADAIRDAVVQRGMFAILYTDNGPGFKDNALIDRACEVLGGTLARALPYNSQAKGLVERFHHTALVRLAKRYPSYIGEDMDKQEATKVQKISLALLKEGTREAKQRLSIWMPTLDVFYRDLLEEQRVYNDTPHSELPRVRDYDTGVLRHMTPNEVWNQKVERGFVAMTGRHHEVEMMCRPTKVVVTRRGEVRFINQIYFSRTLVPLHGEDVLLRYDFRDGSRVWVFDFDGRLICEALFEGNSVDAKPRSAIEAAQEAREKGQFSRLVTKAKTITGHDVELVVKDPEQSRQVIDIEAQKAKGRALIEQDDADRKAKAATQLTLPNKPSAKYAMWEEMFTRQQSGEELSDVYAKWVKGYPRSKEWAAVREMLTTDGETVISYHQQSA
ncbi:Mu transposase C-terminal domain-containing protein [Aeromonas hydrophila]|uniref:Mu transposase C-terminal domain-containing protein n=1 Tax=Aeromonas hydrophila TaxID=644 RepID=UPI000690E064|nr:Mu transposase C-terminal domain-containing protein [Aeromonas hydrophila]